MPSLPEIANKRRRERYRDEPAYRKAKLKANRANYKINGKAHKVRKQTRYSPERAKDIALRSRYGMTLVEFYALLDSQGGVCAICKKHKLDKIRMNLCVDHDHKTGRVRGILCFQCNKGLGHFNDSPNDLRAAADYLEKQK